MKALSHPSFRADSPELFDYSLLDSPKVEAIALQLASAVRKESLFIPSQRNLTGGLRKALIVIATETDVI